MKADLNNDKPITLPLIAISRSSDITIQNVSRRALTLNAMRIDSGDGGSKYLNGVPIELSYQIDIYTRYFAEADEYWRNFIFNLINYPKLTINIPYNDANIEHESAITLNETSSDNSDVPERLIAGQFSRMTINVTVSDAYLFSVPFKENWKVEYDFEIGE